MKRLLLLALLFLLAGCATGEDAARKEYSVPACIEKLKDPDPKVRYTAAKTLGTYGPEAASAVPALTEALKDSDKDVRLGAAYALAEVGPEAKSAIPALEAALKDPDKDVRKAADYALKRLKGTK